MYDLQPATAALHQGSLNAFSSIAGLLLDSGHRTLDICSAARQDLLESLQADDGALPRLDAGKTGDTLHRHSLALTQEGLGALMALQEEAIRFFEGHSHGLSAFVAHSIEKAGKGLPAEILPAVNLFQKSVTQLDHTLGHLAANASHTASHTAAQAATQIEASLAEESAANEDNGGKPRSAARRKGA